MKWFTLLIFIFIIALSCSIHKNTKALNTAGTKNNKQLIKDCPEELIYDKMPSVGKNPKTANNQYFIYKGLRRELSEFDTIWVRKNCKIQTTVVR